MKIWRLLGLLAICNFQLAVAQEVVGLEKTAPEVYQTVKHPEWSKNASIYEVNIRQYTSEGTFKAFEKHLPRLKDLGVNILWLMPVQPIGQKNRKGSIGSYYSVQDYFAVNPEFGTMEEFKSLVDEIHEMGMYVIIDWVANHTAWGNPLTEEHPEWYSKNFKGEFQPTPGYDWSDVIDLEYENKELWAYMTDALKFWVKEANIDGYRCDVAGFVPVEFWDQARAELDKIKAVFMLAEWESRDLHKHAFDMTYAWKFYDVLHGIAKGDYKASKMRGYFAHELNSFPVDGYRMYFVDNHDKNSWEGTTFSQFGDALQIGMVLTTMVEGMPLLYNGQEMGMNKQLAFFEKDQINWEENHEFTGLYKKLLALKKENKALWNGKYGGRMTLLETNEPQAIFGFVRTNAKAKVMVICNLSEEEQKFELSGNDIYTGNYQNLFSGKTASITKGQKLSIKPWGYKVLYVNSH